MAASLLTTEGSIDVLGDRSSVEAECVVRAFGGDLWLGAGSDHTDRKAETVGISLSKQMRAKPVTGQVWRFREVAPHWDQLVLRSHVRINGSRWLYQEGPVTTMRPPTEFIRLYTGGDTLPEGSSVFCDTLATATRSICCPTRANKEVCYGF